MTLKKQTPLMTEEELGEYNHHVQNLNFDAADHRMKYRISQTKDGIPYLQAMPYKHPPVWSKHSLPALNAMIYKGLVEVEEATDGHPIIRPKAQSPNLSPRQDTPMAWMTPEEIKEFDQSTGNRPAPPAARQLRLRFLARREHEPLHQDPSNGAGTRGRRVHHRRRPSHREHEAPRGLRRTNPHARRQHHVHGALGPAGNRESHLTRRGLSSASLRNRTRAPSATTFAVFPVVEQDKQAVQQGQQDKQWQQHNQCSQHSQPDDRVSQQSHRPNMPRLAAGHRRSARDAVQPPLENELTMYDAAKRQ